MLKENKRIHKRAMRYFEELGLIGRVVIVDNKIQAYTFGYQLNDKTFCVLFEITNLKLKGLSVFIFREFCKDIVWQALTFVNVMDGFGLDNVKKTKRSFSPVMIMPSFTLKVD